MWQCTLEVLGQTIRVRNKHGRGHDLAPQSRGTLFGYHELVNIISFIDVVANTYIRIYGKYHGCTQKDQVFASYFLKFPLPVISLILGPTIICKFSYCFTQLLFLS